MEIKTIECHANGAHVFSRRIILARPWTQHDGLSKVRNSVWFGQEGQKLICVGCRRDSQSRKTNRLRKCCPFSSRTPFAHFWIDPRFGNFPACRSGVYFVFQKHCKTNRFRRPGPARNMCVSGLGRDVFLGGRFRERSVLDRFCSESINHVITFDQHSRIDSRRHTQK